MPKVGDKHAEKSGSTEDKSMTLRFAVVYEQTPNNYAAYLPDLPGCISTGETWNDIQEMIREAITLYIEAALEDGEALPEPRMSVEGAMAYHSQNLIEFREASTEADDDVPTLSTTFEMVEVEVALCPTGAVG